MISDILAGVLLGACLTLIGAFAFTFLARRRCWIDLKVAPHPADPNDSIDHMALMQLMDKYDELDARLADNQNKVEDITRVLDPYILSEQANNTKIADKGNRIH